MTFRSCAIAIAGASFLVGVATADDDSAKKDLTALQGEWQCVSVESGERTLSEPECKAHKLTVKGNKVSHLHGAKVSPEATIKLNPSENPRAMDMSAPEGMLLGIYSLENDTIRMCIGAPGEKRPTEFKGGKRQLFSISSGRGTNSPTVSSNRFAEPSDARERRWRAGFQ